MPPWLRNFLENRRIRKMGFTIEQWEEAVADWPVAQRYRGAEREALRALTFRFLARKRFVSGAGFQITDEMGLLIATMACVPILGLGLEWYREWDTLIVYDADFIPDGPYMSEDGVVHEDAPALSGEAWLQGPVILSWEAILMAGPASSHGHAYNVVIHEMAHKLDMLHDGANGGPPLHPGMKQGEWRDVFTRAWEQLNDDWEQARELPVDDYALSHPAEFFAVCSETFFEAPWRLWRYLPDVYRLLSQFYRQDPMA